MTDAIMLHDLGQRARRELERYPDKILVWLKAGDAKVAFGWNAKGDDVELIEFIPAAQARPQNA